MEIKEVIGIDASKLMLDCRVHTKGTQDVFDNDLGGIAQMVDWALETSGTAKENLLFVFEYTGPYTHHLVRYLYGNGFLLHVVPGLEIKRSLGIARGKDDKADAERIAVYGYRKREEIEPFQMAGESLERIKRFMSMRKKLVAQKAGHMATLGEQRRVLDVRTEQVLFRVQEELIEVLGQQIAAIEREMDDVVAANPRLKELMRLLTSITGIGKVTARFIIAYTAGFTAFDQWRKFASYIGIAPYPYRSGTSIKGRTKVSHLARKEGKVLIHMCALTAIQYSPEMRAYYERRLKEGKNKMSTLNIIRNKLLARVFAVAKRGTPYVDIMRYAA